MDFKDSYFQNEVKDGFFVPTMMKRAWAAQLEILADIDMVCKKHNITYYAEWGTLLGAVRHGGYIPWDDDFDICMKRMDYRKFLEVAAQELPSNYYLNNFHNENDFTDYMTRVVNEHAISFEAKHMEKYHGFPYVSGIDIFVLDYMAPSEDENIKQVELLKQIAGQIAELTVNIERMSAESWDIAEKELRNSGSPVWYEKKNYLEKIASEYGLKIPDGMPLLRRLYVLSEEIMALYSDTVKYPNPEKITLMPLWVNGGQYAFPAYYYDQTVDMYFEGVTIRVPYYYDAILRKKYGEYWKLVRRGSSHNYPFYRVQEEVVHELRGTNRQNYAFDLDKFLKHDNKCKEPKKLSKEYGELLKKITELVVQSIARGDAASLEVLFQKGQEVAIQWGTFLENLYGENLDAVHALEEYCETLYQIGLVVQGELREIPLDGLIINAKKSIEDAIGLGEMLLDEKKRIVFLVKTSEDFWVYKEIFERLAYRDDCVVSVVAVPYYRKKVDGILEGPLVCLDGYQESVVVKDGKNFDIAKYQPDLVFICDPFDMMSEYEVEQPEYHSANLCQFSRRIIYVPRYEVEDFDSSDERSLDNMDYYVLMPALVHADEIIVSTEIIRKRYIEKLVKWSKQEMSLWETRIYSKQQWLEKMQDGYDSENQKAMDQIKDSSMQGENNNTSYKTLVFFVSASCLLEKKEEKITKLKEVLDTFLRNKSKIQVLWIRDKLVSVVLQEQLELLNKYYELQQNFVENKIGRLLDETEFRNGKMVVDAYYGDPGWISSRIVVEKKPVMIMIP